MTPRAWDWLARTGRSRGMMPLVCAVLAAMGTVALSAGSAGAARSSVHILPDSWCSGGGPTPCIVSATRNGAPVADGDPNYYIGLSAFTDRGSSNFSLNVESTTHGDQLGASALSDVWSIVVNTGTMVPRVAAAQGASVSFTRSPQPGGTYRATFTGTPIVLTNNAECDFSGSIPSCPYHASSEYDGYLAVAVSDYNLPSLYTPAQVSSFYGMDLSTNITETGLPPQIVPDPSTGSNQVVLQLANQHQYPDGSEFVGFLHLVIPDSFLEAVYGVNDPATVTTDGLAASIGSGTVTIQQAPGALLLDLTGVTFTHRTLRIRLGVITPTRPTRLHARRTSRRRGKVSFRAASPRGSRITGYRLTCGRSAGSGELTAQGSHSPIEIGGLVGRSAYRCTVRARSKAGLGRPSSTVKLPA